MLSHRPYFVTLLASLVVLGVAGVASASAREAAAPDARPMLLMHYMPWYEAPDTRGRWGEHWTGWERQHDPSKTNRDGLPDIWSHYHPLIGTYDSADPHVLECQLLQMRIAGVDAVVADWYGIADEADYPSIHTATEALFAAAGELGMGFAACYEDRTVQLLIERRALDEGNIDEHLAETFAWLDETWFGADHYVRLDGDPVVLNFGPIYVKDVEAWRAARAAVEGDIKLFTLHHLWKGVQADGGFMWFHKDAWKGLPDDDAVQAHLDGVADWTADDRSQVIPSAVAGFHDVYATSYGYLPHRGGETLEESLDWAMRAGSPMVQLATWNDYGEGTIFEPTHQFGYRFLEIVQDARREADASFTFTHDDLRMPMRLLELRRAGKVEASRIDAIVEAIAADDAARARALFAELPK